MDKKRDEDVDVFAYAVFTSIKPGVGKSTCRIANKKEWPDARSIFLSQNPPSMAGFGASLVLSTISFTWELALIINFKKVDTPDMKN